MIQTDDHKDAEGGYLRGPAYYYISTTNDPYRNVATEDFLYQRMKHLDCIYMLWVNEPSVFMGRYQSPRAETDWAYLEAEHIPLVRRNSGGGTVYHDLGNLNYTCIANDTTGRGHNLALFPEPIIDGARAQGVDLIRSPRGDLRYKGLKVAGSAEALRAGRMLYHMSLLFDADLDRLERVLSVPEGTEARSRVASVRSVVCNLKPLLGLETMEDFKTLLMEQIGAKHSILIPLTLPDEAEDYIRERIAMHFASREWTFSTMGDAKQADRSTPIN